MFKFNHIHQPRFRSTFNGLTSRLRRSFVVIFILTLSQMTTHQARAAGACFDPAIEGGYASKDTAGEWLVIARAVAPPKGAAFGDMVFGIGVKGLYYGCSASEKIIRPRTVGVRKFNVFLPIRNAPVQGFELDISTESRRVLGARSIQVPWDVVNRSKGVTANCTPSTSTAFEGFLYGALRIAKSRRCTETEIQALVGKNKKVPVDSSPRGAWKKVDGR